VFQLKAVDENSVIFKSSFFGTFGFDIFAKPPETIDFNEVFTNIDQKILDTPHVLALNCVLIGCLLVGSVILRQFDKKDSEMVRQYIGNLLCINYI